MYNMQMSCKHRESTATSDEKTETNSPAITSWHIYKTSTRYHLQQKCVAALKENPAQTFKREGAGVQC
jgi:hypothetical protein